jgi:Lar family restriction alleviation protein
MAEQKPCPFCGGKAVFGCEYGLTRMHYYKRCSNCGARGPMFPEEEGGQARAEAAWNERTSGVDVLGEGER